MAGRRENRLNQLLDHFNIEDRENVPFETFEQLVKLLKTGTLGAASDETEMDDIGFHVLDMFDEALQETAEVKGEDVETPNVASIMLVIERNGLGDAVVPRVFTNGFEVVLMQA